MIPSTDMTLTRNLLKQVSILVSACLLRASAQASLLIYDGFTAGNNPGAGEYTAAAGGGSDYRLKPNQNPDIEGFTGNWDNPE